MVDCRSCSTLTTTITAWVGRPAAKQWRIGSWLESQPACVQMHCMPNESMDIIRWRSLTPTAANCRFLRTGQGPVLLDVVTYRLTGHSCADVCPYREESEAAAWAEFDAVERYPEALIAAGIASAEEIEQIRQRVLARNKKVFHLAADPQISPYVDFDKDKGFIERPHVLQSAH